MLADLASRADVTLSSMGGRTGDARWILSLALSGTFVHYEGDDLQRVVFAAWSGAPGGQVQ